jgi:hypothetical protein
LEIYRHHANPGGFSIRWSSQPNRKYRLLRSADLSANPAAYQVIQTGLAATPPINEVADTTTGGALFFLRCGSRGMIAAGTHMKSLYQIGVIALLTSFPSGMHAQWVQQTISLKAGWNAIFLNVQPEPADCDALFAGLPVESVWDFNPSVNAPQFVQDLASLIPGSPGWLTWFPATSPQSGIGNLFAMRDGRPYLVKLADNAPPVNWTVTGRPSLRPITWRPGGVNFVGFRVGPTGPTFQTLFAGEPGLVNQPVYALGTSGDWQPLVNLTTARPESGKAYWIRCMSPAQRAGTIVVEGRLTGLVFSGGAWEQSLRIRNASGGTRNISVRLLASSPSPAASQPSLARCRLNIDAPITGTPASAGRHSQRRSLSPASLPDRNGTSASALDYRGLRRLPDQFIKVSLKFRMTQGPAGWSP